MRWPASLRARLGLWHSILLGVPLVVFALICWLAFSRALLAGTDRFMAEALAAFRRELTAERRAGLPADAAIATTVQEVRFRDMHIAVLDADGRVVAIAGQPWRPGATPAPLTGEDALLVRTVREARTITGPQQVTLATGTGAARVRTEPLPLDGRTYLLAARYPLREVETTMRSISGMFSVAIPLLIVAAAVSGYVLARRSLAPVALMAERAAEISDRTLDARMPVQGGEELQRLASGVNALLDRLERSFEQQRRFMADASHELRTPTAIVRTEADVTLSLPHRSEPEYRDAIATMQDAARRLTRIVDDLFLLARSDAGHLVTHRVPLHLEDVVDDAIRGVRPLAAQRGVQVRLEHAVEHPMTGDPDLLGRLLLNLLDNAVKYSVPDGQVTVAMATGAAGTDVTVTDTGPGIPAEAQPHVFERFFRADAARTRPDGSPTGGAGLGLAIARRIAEVHEGTLVLETSAPGRTVFRLCLPPGPALPPVQRPQILQRS